MKRSPGIDLKVWSIHDIELLCRGTVPFPVGLELASDIVVGGNTALSVKGALFTEQVATSLKDRVHGSDGIPPIDLRVNDALRSWGLEQLLVHLKTAEAEIRNCSTFGPSFVDVPELSGFFRDILEGEPDVSWNVYRAIGAMGSGPMSSQALRRSMIAVVLLEFLQEFGRVDLDPVTDYGPVIRASLLLLDVATRGVGDPGALPRRNRTAAIEGVLATFDVPEEADTDARSVLMAARRIWAGGSDDRSEERIAMLAWVLVMAELLTVRRNRFFHEPASLKSLVEELLQEGLSHQSPAQLVEAVARGFSYAHLFDFYREIDEILGSCSEGAGSPHPVRPGVSATLVLCSKSKTACPHFGGLQTEAVWIADGELPAGCYGTCRLMTPRLQALYIDHYDRIKGA